MKNKQKLIMCKGLPASGKSTWAKKLVTDNEKFKRINKDDLRAMLDNSRWSKHNENYVLRVRDFMIEEALVRGFSVISDDTNLAPKHEERFIELVDGFNKAFDADCAFELKDFTDVSPQECIKRDAVRANPVGEKVILGMYNQFLRKPQPKYVPPSDNLPKAVICDLDGTLAILNGRDPYDASTCVNDDVNHALKGVLDAMLAYGKIHQIIFLSGRDGKYRVPTENFLRKAGYAAAPLFMRTEGDNRKDCIIKKELFEAHIHGKYNPILWFDDRQQVVDMVRRELGITVFQVNEGLF
jgi:predicted kinase